MKKFFTKFNKNKYYFIKHWQNKGFTLLFTAILASVILAIALSISNIVFREIQFGTSAKDTNDAFFAADTGAECALYNDKSSGTSFVQTGGSGTVNCLGQTLILNGAYPSWNFIIPGLGGAGQGCAKVTVDKTDPANVSIIAKGYNIGGTLCASTSSNLVERELQATFVENNPVKPSPNLTWTGRNASLVGNWYAVTYGNGLFVAVNSASTNLGIMTSPNGVTWTTRSTPVKGLYSVTYGNGIFVALSTTASVYSSNGINWYSGTAFGSSNYWYSVIYANGKFVAVGSNVVMTSPDGITWTLGTPADTNNWNSITYGNGLFVAVASTGTSRVMTSPDGITWTLRSASQNDSWNSVVYGNNLFVATAYNGSGSRVMTSPDGITWTARTAAENDAWYSVTYGGGLYVAVATNGNGINRTMASPDGITWTANPAVENDAWYSVTYGGGLYVAIAVTNVGTYQVMTAGTYTPP